MSRRGREPCRNFQRGSCQYGDRCKFLHVSQQPSRPNSLGFGTQNTSQSRPNSLGFGTQNTSQFFNTSQQQKPNPFGFGVQNGSSSKETPSFGGRNESTAKPFENKWVRPSSTTTTNSAQQASTQQQPTNHQCTDPESCKRIMVEDFKNELPLWRLTCYGHWKNRPCDIVGDISYEELRAAAYEDARKGLPLPAIVERERNLYNSKCSEFDNLIRNPYVVPNSSLAQTNFSTGANNTPLIGVPNNTPVQNNAPPLFSSFSQLGTNLGSSVRPQAPPATPNSFFGQLNLPQYNSQNSAGLQMKFDNPGLFGSQLPSQPSGSSPGLNNAKFPNTVMPTGSERASPLVTMQFPSSTNNQSPSFLDVPAVVSDTILASILEKQEDGPDDSIWLKTEWAIGEIPIVVPPERFCL